MESRVVDCQAVSKGINFNEPQLVYYTATSDSCIILTTGIHDGDSFSGVVISTDIDFHHLGKFSQNWSKASFDILSENIEIVIKN